MVMMRRMVSVISNSDLERKKAKKLSYNHYIELHCQQHSTAMASACSHSLHGPLRLFDLLTGNHRLRVGIRSCYDADQCDVQKTMLCQRSLSGSSLLLSQLVIFAWQ